MLPLFLQPCLYSPSPTITPMSVLASPSPTEITVAAAQILPYNSTSLFIIGTPSPRGKKICIVLLEGCDLCSWGPRMECTTNEKDVIRKRQAPLCGLEDRAWPAAALPPASPGILSLAHDAPGPGSFRLLHYPSLVPLQLSPPLRAPCRPPTRRSSPATSFRSQL